MVPAARCGVASAPAASRDADRSGLDDLACGDEGRGQVWSRRPLGRVVYARGTDRAQDAVEFRREFREGARQESRSRELANRDAVPSCGFQRAGLSRCGQWTYALE